MHVDLAHLRFNIANWKTRKSPTQRRRLTKMQRKYPPQVKKVTSGKYFKDLIKLPLTKLLDHSTAKSAFAKAMEYPLQQLREKTAKAKLEGKPLEVIEWPTDDEVQELIDLLKSIDKGFDISIRAWGKFKSHMPVLYEWYQTHVRNGKYLSEFSKCDKSSCTICRLSSEGLRTPNTEDGMLCYTLLCPMDYPVNNPSDPGHFLPPNKTAKYIAEKKLTFKQLMKELPNKDSHPFQCAQAKADKCSDDTAGGSKLFKGDKVRHIAFAIIATSAVLFIRCAKSIAHSKDCQNGSNKSD